MKDNVFDVIVIGAGHAGCEAALAASRMGARTLLLTISLDTMAWMPCNSSIGGPGRGQLVREIDALGGEIARCADRTTLHSRRSNIAKGPAVQAPFVIVDRRQYQLVMKYLLEETDNLHVRQALIETIQPGAETLTVTSAFSEKFEARAVVLAAGTFMRGEVVYGDIVEQAGRYSEIAAPEISRNLEAMGFAMGRFKTGTSPRVSAESVDVSVMEAQMPDERPEPASFWTELFTPSNQGCHKTRTTEKTRETVLKYLQQSVLFKGGSRPVGARYCPSIEDKVAHGADRPGHPVFLQSQSADGAELYIQGLSTSLPPAVQEEMIRTVPGLEHARIMRPGYAVMYDYIFPDQLLPSLETKLVGGLFTAGQINGTSGYEEAAAQGLIAGINAALKAKGEAPFVLDRSQAYIGVLIDDLVTKGVDEPYRMFTSRAEYRLILRSDNADMRLSKFGFALGLIDEGRYARVLEKEEFVGRMAERTKEPPIEGDTLAGHIRREIEARSLYKGYILQEQKRIAQFMLLENVEVPEEIDYRSMKGLSNEAVEKLSSRRPRSIGQASRIPGLRPPDIQILHIYVKQFHKEQGPQGSKKEV